MLDKRAFRLLEVIMSMAEEGVSSVLDKTELLEELGEGWDDLALNSAMEVLALSDMLTILYTDDSLFCVKPEAKAKIVYQKRVEKVVMADVIESEVSATPSVINFKKLAIICATSSFFGAFVAGVIVFIMAKFG